MAIFLRASAKDNNQAATASLFLGISVPSGTKDGDLVIVGITLPASGVTVTAPDTSWTKITQTDASQTLGLVAYWKTAINEGAHWVFGLSSSIKATGGCLVYGGVDPFVPVESFSGVLTSGTNTDNVPGLTTAVDGDELVLLLGAANAGTFAAVTGFSRIVQSTQASTSAFELQHKIKGTAGVVSPTTVVFTPTAGTPKSAAVLIALRPGVGKLSLDEVRERLLNAMPPGCERIYDFTPTGDYYKYFNSIANTLKLYGFDMVDLLRLEIFPSSCRNKLPDWERIFGLDTTKIAQTGTIPQRQAQLVAAWRAAAGQGASLSEIQNVIGAYLNYNVYSDLIVKYTDRALLTTAHSYQANETKINTSLAIPGPGSVSVYFDVSDRAVVSKAGAIVRLFIDNTHAEQLSFSLVNPSGERTDAWAVGVLTGSITHATEYRIYAPDMAGISIAGRWKLTVTSSATAGTLYNAYLFVDGIGRDVTGKDGLGYAAYCWGVFVDPSKYNKGAGGTVDYSAVQLLIDAFNFAHRRGNIIRGSASVDAGYAYAIPDDANCIPDQVIPH